MKAKIIFLIFFLILLGAGASFYAYSVHRNIKQINANRALLESRRRAWLELKNKLDYKVEHFKGTVGIEIIDLDTGWEIARNKGVLFPSASLAKIPVMLSCFYAAQEGKISLENAITLKSSEKVAGSKALDKEPAGSVFRVKELFGPMITQSDNTAANALIDFIGFDALNAYFKKMGLENTNIARKMMDFEERREGEENYTTAQDMAFILEKIYRKEFLNKDVSEQCLALLGEQKINDRIPRNLPKDGAFIAHKTGLERHICHDAGIVYTRKGDFLICVLVKHRDRLARGAKKLISDLALLTYQYYQNL